MANIEIMNLQDTKPSKPYDFRVDRRTPLGNPFIMSHESRRNSVCDSYETHFPHMLLTSEANKYFIKLLMAYKKYNKLRLFCWCAPKQCHAETIKKELEVYL